MSDNVIDDTHGVVAPTAISESLTPATARVFSVRDPGTHDQVTRKGLAYAVVALLAVLYLGSFAGYLLGDMDQDKFTTLVAAISGPQTLAAAVIGFYYANGKDKNKRP